MADALDGTVLFGGLSADALAGLRRIAIPFAAAAAETLFRQGDPPRGLYAVEAGTLEIATRLPGDDVAQVSAIGPGEVVGEFALLDPGPRSARVTAIAATRGSFIPARSFIAMLEEGRPGAIETIDRLRGLVAGRTRTTLERLAELDLAESSELRGAPGGPLPAATTIDPATILTLTRFADFPEIKIAEWLATGQALAASRNAPITAAGSPPDAAFLVVRGAVRAAFPRGLRREQVCVFAPGEWAGIEALLNGRAHLLELAAAEDSVLLRVSAERFAAWRAAPDAVAGAVLAGLDRQLVRDQRRANRHLGRALALERFNQAGGAA